MLFSQPVLYEVLKAVSDNMFKRKCLFNEEIKFYSLQHLKVYWKGCAIKLEVNSERLDKSY